MNNNPISIRQAANLLGKPIAYWSTFTRLCGGNANAGVFLSQFYYWDGKQEDPNGWIYKVSKQIEKETGLNRYGQENARKKLKTMGVLEEKKKGVPAKLHYKFDWDEVDRLLVLSETGEDIKTFLKHREKAYKEAKAQEPMKMRKTNYFFDSKVVCDEMFVIWQKNKGMKGKIANKIQWTGKEKGSLTNLINYIKERRQADSKDISSEEIAKALKVFLEFYVALSISGCWFAQSFAPSNIYSNIQRIYEQLELHYEEFRKTGKIPSQKQSKQSSSNNKFTSTDAGEIAEAYNYGK